MAADEGEAGGEGLKGSLGDGAGRDYGPALGAGGAGHFGIVRPPVDRHASRAPVGRALVGLGIMVMAMTRIDEFADCSDIGQARKSGGASNSTGTKKRGQWPK